MAFRFLQPLVAANMKRLRSPSLFVTFSASFFGVLALAALLQFLAAFGVLRSVFSRGEKARAELIVREAARSLAALPEDQGHQARHRRPSQARGRRLRSNG